MYVLLQKRNPKRWTPMEYQEDFKPVFKDQNLGVIQQEQARRELEAWSNEKYISAFKITYAE